MNPRAFIHTLIAAVMIAVAGGCANNDEVRMKQSAKEAGRAIGGAAREVGHGAKKAGRTIGHTVRDGAKAVGAAAKDGAHEFKRAVKDED